MREINHLRKVGASRCDDRFPRARQGTFRQAALSGIKRPAPRGLFASFAFFARNPFCSNAGNQPLAPIHFSVSRQLVQFASPPPASDSIVKEHWVQALCPSGRTGCALATAKILIRRYRVLLCFIVRYLPYPPLRPAFPTHYRHLRDPDKRIYPTPPAASVQF
jgi:hypothetical protein